MSPQNEILFMLGELKKGMEHLSAQQEQLHRQHEEERRAAGENRARIHARLDQHIMNVSEIEGKVITIGQAFDTQRALIEGVADKVDKNHKEVQPALVKWRQIETIGWSFSGILISLGITGATVLWWASDVAVTLARRWLRID